jgi:hypothetical protein
MELMVANEAERAQIADQYRAVAALCRNLGMVHEQLVTAIEQGACDDIATIQGPRSAAIMEVLGDILNGMDAVDEEDRWLDPIFEKAHQLYPTARADYMGEQVSA